MLLAVNMKAILLKATLFYKEIASGSALREAERRKVSEISQGGAPAEKTPRMAHLDVFFVFFM